MRRKYWSAILVLAVGLWLVGASTSGPVGAQPPTHTVKKGDTLWDICEEYYGDETLWPKLWEMNPFITNPHLLNPGDVITLLEDVPVKKQPPVETKAPAPTETVDDSAWGETGIDVSGLTNVESIGFLSSKELEPWGYIFSADTERDVISKGDTVYLAMERGRQVEPGDLFTVYQRSELLKHPLTGRVSGCIVSFLGKVALKEKVKGELKEVLYKAEIIDNYRTMHAGDPVLSYEPISPCVQPLPADRELTSCITAVKDLHKIIGQFSVAYLAHGYKHGIRRGNLFEIVKRRQGEPPQKTTLPDVVLGHFLILEARADTATGVVVAAKEEFSNGAFVKGVDLMEAQRVLSSIPECTGK